MSLKNLLKYFSSTLVVVKNSSLGLKTTSVQDSFKGDGSIFLLPTNPSSNRITSILFLHSLLMDHASQTLLSLNHNKNQHKYPYKHHHSQYNYEYVYQNHYLKQLIVSSIDESSIIRTYTIITISTTRENNHSSIIFPILIFHFISI